ncbi:MAG: efflux RND transporter periplasmic adaptor subunit [Xanthobacteraceae bacterium]
MKKSGRRNFSLALAIALAAPALLAGCDSNQYVAPPPPKVVVTTPVQEPVVRYFETTGTSTAINTASLVARVQGFLTEVQYRDGAIVKKDTPLFVIEPEPYKLKYESAQAAQAGAEASLKQLEADYQRQVDLASRQVASKATLDQALAARDGGEAKVKQAEVDTKTAEINYGYTEVKAPFDGVVTARQVSIGDLVGGTTPTVLATIVQFDPIYVNFNVSEKDVLEARKGFIERGETVASLIGKLPIEIGLQTETGFPHKGLLDYVSPTVNPSTGTLMVRGSFENANRTILPGYFVRVRFALDPKPADALLVPDIALGSDQSGRYLLVVNKDNVVEQRKVTPGIVVGEMRVIESGLKADDRVIVGGLLRAVPGQKVDPQVQAAAAPAQNK